MQSGALPVTVLSEWLMLFLQESINMFTMPELLTLMLSVEALEDNEVVTVHGARQIGRINSPKRPVALFEKFDNPKTVS